MNLKKIIPIVPRIVKYNLKIIFGGKFFWFVIAAFLILAYLLIWNVWRGVEMNEAFVYSSLLLPGILLVFYPSVFGIQNDEDNKILEILFGIPNYRYKVWLLRLVMIYIVIALILIVFAVVANYMVYPVNPLEITYRLMFPIIFVGNLAFLFSTITRNGNSTAVLIIILAIAFIIVTSGNMFGINTSMFNVTLNPFSSPSDVHPVIWQNLVFRNMLFLLIGGLVWLMLGLQNLQKREKFV